MDSLLLKFQTAWDADDWHDDEWWNGDEGRYFRMAKEAHEADPENPIWLFWCGRFDQKPIEYFERCLAKASGDFADEVRKELADWYYGAEDDCDKAKALLEIMVNGKFKDDPESNFKLSEIYLWEDDYQNAEYYAMRVLNLNESIYTPRAHFILGDLCSDLENWFKAIEHYRKVVQLMREKSNYANECLKASAKVANILDMFHSEEAMEFYQIAYEIGLKLSYRGDVELFNNAFRKADPEKWEVIGPLVEDYAGAFSLANLDKAFVHWDMLPKMHRSDIIIYHTDIWQNLLNISKTQQFVLHAVNKSFTKELVDLIHSFLYFMAT